MAVPDEQWELVPCATEDWGAASPDQGQRPYNQVLPVVGKSARKACLRSRRTIRDDAARALAARSTRRCGGSSRHSGRLRRSTRLGLAAGSYDGHRHRGRGDPPPANASSWPRGGRDLDRASRAHTFGDTPARCNWLQLPLPTRGHRRRAACATNGGDGRKSQTLRLSRRRKWTARQVPSAAFRIARPLHAPARRAPWS